MEYGKEPGKNVGIYPFVLEAAFDDFMI